MSFTRIKSIIFYQNKSQSTVFLQRNCKIFERLELCPLCLLGQWFPTFFSPRPIFILKIFHGPPQSIAQLQFSTILSSNAARISQRGAFLKA